MSEPIPFGPYELLERIAEGGMAEVWRARSRGIAGFEKTLVIKRLLPELMANTALVDLLIREAKIAARLNHANIVQIFDLGLVEGTYYIAMEYVPGRDLGAVLGMEQKLRSKRDTAALPIGVKLWIVAEAAKALDYAHRRKGEDGHPLKIVHRDVSPQNILLGYEGAVKVADFGIARADEQGLGRGEDPRLLRGKYSYMSPEQARGEALDRRSDIFSLGVVLYEALTRRRLFRGANAADTLERVRQCHIPELRTDELGLPPKIKAVVSRALAKDRADRYDAASDLQGDLAEVISHLGAPASAGELADAMARLFPRREEGSPNKLRVDLLVRVQDDATSMAQELDRGTGSANEGDTTSAAIPASKRIVVDQRPVALLAVSTTAVSERAFLAAVTAFDGMPIPSGARAHYACFGAAGGERSDEAAVRAAFESFRRSELEGLGLQPPAAVVTRVVARVFQGGGADPGDDALEVVLPVLDDAPAGTVVVDAELRDELRRTFHLGESLYPERLLVTGFRVRREREMLVDARQLPIMGRRSELEQLTTAVARAGSGAPTAVMVVGDPGVGKSRLIAELHAALTTQGVTVLSARSRDTDRDRPYAALSELVMDVCGIEDGDGQAERFSKIERLRVLGLSPERVRTLGGLVGLAFPVSPLVMQARPRGFEIAVALRQVIRSLSVDRVVVLVFEDVHLMDLETRQVFNAVVAAHPYDKLCTIVTTRPGPEAPVQRGLEVLHLERLADAPARRLLASHLAAREVDDALFETVAVGAAGNPRWIGLAARSLLAEGAVTVHDGIACMDPSFVLVPSREMLDLVAGRLAALRPDDAMVLRLAALSPSWVGTILLASVIAAPTESVARSVRRLVLRRYLESDERAADATWGGDFSKPPARVRVPAALVRRSIAESMPVDERQRWHAKFASLLERSSSVMDETGLRELAWHHARARNALRAAELWSQVAARAAARGDARETLQAHEAGLEQALRAADARPTAEALMLVVVGLEAMLATGRIRACAVALDRMPRVTSEGEVGVRLSLVRASVMSRVDGPRRALGALSAAWDSLADLTDRELQGRALLELGEAKLEVEGAAAVETLQAATETLSGRPTPLLLRALCSLTVALVESSELDASRETFESARKVAGELWGGDASHSFELEAMMGELALLRSRPREARQAFERAAELARAAGRGEVIAPLALRGALSALVVADLDLARRLTELGRVQAGAHGLPSLLAVATCVESALFGDIASSAAARPEPWFTGAERALVHLAMAVAAEQRGDGAKAQEARAAAVAAARDCGRGQLADALTRRHAA